MKKILARLAQADSDDLANSHNSQSGNLNRHYASFLGRHFRIGHFSLIVDEIIAEGGFGVVFRVHSQQGQYYALKRTCVNCERDLALCKREVTIVGQYYALKRTCVNCERDLALCKREVTIVDHTVMSLLPLRPIISWLRSCCPLNFQRLVRIVPVLAV
ncbi:hypothetical protein AHF37_07945 [Paragonimus kellicotti]|nr:hypothetical protein AHF37_07945 [Paragonimus kellicotti]